MTRRNLGPDNLVIEAASNDGCMLRNFVAAGIPVLGIDPADGPVARAQEIGVRTRHGFFTRDTAVELSGEGLEADVFLANNVLAHVADLNGFVEFSFRRPGMSACYVSESEIRMHASVCWIKRDRNLRIRQRVGFVIHAK